MRKRITGSIALGLLVLVVSAGVGLLTAQEEAEPVSALSDTEVGLAKGSVFDVPAPPVPEVNVADPGDMPPAGRAFGGAPPRVPHAVGDFMPITRDENWCVDCHALDWTAPDGEDPTAIPVSHYVNLRSDTDEIGGRVVGARWVCVSCHVPETSAPALVGNLFGD
ncbi:MAG: nitrate reductase cytochrome c-type subunit [Thermoanaerobaculia bacterium]